MTKNLDFEIFLQYKADEKTLWLGLNKTQFWIKQELIPKGVPQLWKH